MREQFKLIGLILCLAMKYGIQSILMPLMGTGIYTSMNFILMNTCIQSLIVFGSIYFYLYRKNGFLLPRKKKSIVFLSGIPNGLMGIAMIYSANTSRTPVFIQAVLAGMPILPCVFFRRKLLHKISTYNYKLITLSIITLISSIVVSTIPIYDISKAVDDIEWIILYIISIICMSAYSVLQEKYISETEDERFYNKISFLFYSNIIRFLIIIALSWLEFFLGFTKHPIEAFIDSMKNFGESPKALLLFEAFTSIYIGAYIIEIELNVISANYTMLIPIISTPITIIFFSTFGSYNHGLHYPLWNICTCISLSVIGIVLWIKGETTKITYIPMYGDNSLG